jgi:hypothetical protein
MNGSLYMIRKGRLRRPMSSDYADAIAAIIASGADIPPLVGII